LYAPVHHAPFETIGFNEVSVIVIVVELVTVAMRTPLAGLAPLPEHRFPMATFCPVVSPCGVQVVMPIGEPLAVAPHTIENCGPDDWRETVV
jgi:hypothetical protein